MGWKSLVEFYSNPTDQMTVYAEGAPEIYIGPKAVPLGDQNFDEYRLGAFITGFKIGKVALDVSGGYLHDENQGSGYFVGTIYTSASKNSTIPWVHC